MTNKFSSIITIISLLSALCSSQNNELADSTKVKLIQTAREIIASSGTCELTTIDNEGLVRTRVMSPFAPESDMTIWLGTNSNSRKVQQIKNNPKVTLFYLDSDKSGYVTIQGNAELINDTELKNVYWKPEWERFYPNRPDGYILIKVIPKWMEVLSYSRGIFGDSMTWEPPKVIFNQEY